MNSYLLEAVMQQTQGQMTGNTFWGMIGLYLILSVLTNFRLKFRRYANGFDVSIRIGDEKHGS